MTTPHQPQPHTDGWQTIETAPHGWIDILLYVPDEDDGTGSQGVVKGWYSEKDGGFDCWMTYEASSSAKIVPTMWQPLPKPPSTTQSQKTGR